MRARVRARAWFTGDHPKALGVFTRAIDGLPDEARDLRERLEAEVISSAWWEPEFLPIAVEYLERIRPDELSGGLGSRMLLASLGFMGARRGLEREQSVEYARPFARRRDPPAREHRRLPLRGVHARDGRLLRRCARRIRHVARRCTSSRRPVLRRAGPRVPRLHEGAPGRPRRGDRRPPPGGRPRALGREPGRVPVRDRVPLAGVARRGRRRRRGGGAHAPADSAGRLDERTLLLLAHVARRSASRRASARRARKSCSSSAATSRRSTSERAPGARGACTPPAPFELGDRERALELAREDSTRSGAGARRARSASRSRRSA